MRYRQRLSAVDPILALRSNQRTARGPAAAAFRGLARRNPVTRLSRAGPYVPPITKEVIQCLMTLRRRGSPVAGSALA